MEIGQIGQSSDLLGTAIKGASDYELAPEISFSRRLTQLTEQSFKMYLDALYERIYAQGQRMAQKADFTEFHNYRLLVSRFIFETVSNAYSLHKDGRHTARGRTLTLIKRINAKLDEMAQQVLCEQADNLKIMGMAEEIRGMLVDLYL